jgi:hypothetical protein
MPGSHRVPKSKRRQSIGRDSLFERLSELISLRERVAQAELAGAQPLNAIHEEVAGGRQRDKRRPTKSGDLGLTDAAD